MWVALSLMIALPFAACGQPGRVAASVVAGLCLQFAHCAYDRRTSRR